MSEKKELTPRELEILSNVWFCMKTEPEVDYAKLAEVMGMTNVRSASNAWAKIKGKLFVNPDPSTPKSNGKKRAASTDADTPSTKKTKSGRGKKAKKDEAVESEEEYIKKEKFEEADGDDGIKEFV